MVAGQAMGLWEAKDCASVRSKYICKQNQDSSFIPSPPAPQPTPSLTGSCPSGWKSTNKFHHCYKVCLSQLCASLELKMPWKFHFELNLYLDAEL